MALQNFVDGSTPLISAAWLNSIDAFYTTLFASSTTAATARAAISAANISGLNTQDFSAKFLIADKITLSAGTTSVAPVNKTAGTNLTTPIAGAEEYDGKVFYDTPTASNRGLRNLTHFTALTADFTGTDVATAQPFFSTAQDVITLPASTSYEFEAVISMSRAAGAVSHTIGILFGGTATLTSIGYSIDATSTVGNVLGTYSSIFALTAAAVVCTAASVSTTENNLIKLKGILRVNGGGTLIPQFIYSAAPGGVPTIRANSYFKLTPLGINTVASVGNWS